MAIKRVMPAKVTIKKAELIKHLMDGFEKQFGSPMPRLDVVAPVYFGCTGKQAAQSYAAGILPVNIHRLGSRNSPPVISVAELAAHAYEQIQEKQP